MDKPEIQQSEKGFKIVPVSLDNILSWGSLGLCDNCAKPLSKGIFIGALNSVYCENCFNEWHNRATFHHEDKPYEEMASQRILNLIS